MPEETDPPQPVPPEQPTLLGDLAPDEMFARAMQTVKMTSGTTGPWQPPTVEECARLFPGYEVLRLLGRGGMGAVYQARQIELDRLVAIKLLPLEISVDKDFADRFRREARAMAKLNHPNIIAVYDFGTTREGHLFFVMEFVDGANLFDIIHQVGLDGDQALSVVEQVCTALAYAHNKGIVHRDIKPANVMIDTESHVKVADFGLARLTDPGTADLGHTMTGTVMGTPDYMAPEQTRGMNVDHRADIYSLGVMLYEMLCREVPKGIFDPPSHRTGCDARIDQIVIKAMQQVPDRRFQSTQDMRTAITAARTPVEMPAPAGSKAAAAPGTPKKPAAPKAPGAAIPQKPAVMKTIPPPRSKKSKMPLYAGIAVGFLAVGAVGYFFLRPKSEALTKAQQYAAEHGGATSVVSNREVDLLPLIDVKRDAVLGEWENGPVGLIIKRQAGINGKGEPRMQLPYVPPEEYDFEIEFTPHDNGGNLGQILYAPDRSFMWSMDVGGNTAPVMGFSDIDGKSVFIGTEGKVRRDHQLISGQRYRSTVEVRHGSIRGLLDGQEVVKWVGDFRRLSLGGGFAVRDEGHLGLQASNRSVTFHKITVREISGAGTVTGGVASSAGISVAGGSQTATKDAPFVNSLGMKFVPVPGTDILMCIHETRRKDYGAYANAVPGLDATWKTPIVNGKPLEQTDDHPVVMVGWEDANAFCAWLSKKEGRAYRLPTDYEWNLAVVTGLDDPKSITPGELMKKLSGQYPWGSTNEADAARFCNYLGKEDGFEGTAPVMSFQPNPLGIYDLGGNAWEWSDDWFDAYHKQHVLRGGGYLNFGPARKSSWRVPADPGFRAMPDNDFNRRVPGFRLVLANGSPNSAAAVAKSDSTQSNPGKSVSSNPSGEPWQDALRDPAKLSFNGGAERTPEGLRFTGTGIAAYFPTRVPPHDGAVRMRTTFGPVHASLARQAPNSAGSYQCFAENEKLIVLGHNDAVAKKWTVLREFPLREPLQPGQEYELELRIVSQTLTAKFNGEVLGTATDGTIPVGFFGAISTSNGTTPVTVKSLEVLDLDVAGDASTVRATSTPVVEMPAAKSNPPAEKEWVTYAGKPGPGAGKHVVFISGDEEYRSEESLPMLAKILSQRHGFKCTALFAVDKGGFIDPQATDNLPGAEALDSADAIVLFTRWRAWPDAQMKHFVDAYLRGVPIVGMRTATHAFRPAANSSYPQFANFGKAVLGSGWLSHWGEKTKEGTRTVVEPTAKNDPILRGVDTIFGNREVYEAYPPADARILLRGQVVTGTNRDDPPAQYKKRRTTDQVEQGINDPMMPVAWTREFKNEAGRTNKIFCTTLGTPGDLQDESMRRLIVNSVFALLGVPVPAKADVNYIGYYVPTPADMGRAKKGVRPSDLALEASGNAPAAPPVPAAAPSASAEAGFRPIFNGTLAGWGDYSGAAPSAGWRVQDGAIVATGDRTWLVTKEAFGDFELRLEWKVGPDGNGGIFFHMLGGEGNRPLTAPEFQLCARDVKDAFQTGALYKVLKAEDASLPTGQWNTARLIVQGGRCEHWVNDKLVLSYDLKSDEWKKQWQASAFGNDPRFAQATQGSIGLQGWTGEIAYRNIRIRPLAAGAPR